MITREFFGDFSRLDYQGRLIFNEMAPQYIKNFHDSKQSFKCLEFLVLDSVLIGGLGLIKKNNFEFLFPKECFPSYLEKSLQCQINLEDDKLRKVWAGELLNHDFSNLEKHNALIFPMHPNLIFGHFLLEILPKIILLDLLVESSIPLVISSKAPDWVSKIIESCINGRELKYYDHTNTVISLKECFTCTNIFQQDVFHPVAKLLYSLVYERIALKNFKKSQSLDSCLYSEKIFISRSRIKKRSWHNISNELALEKIAESHGFTVIHPQELSFESQVILFRNAKYIIGEYSSSLHNAVFSSSGTTVICLNCINVYQSAIAKLMEHRVGYIQPVNGYRGWETAASGFQEIVIDELLFDGFVSSLLN